MPKKSVTCARKMIIALKTWDYMLDARGAYAYVRLDHTRTATALSAKETRVSRSNKKLYKRGTVLAKPSSSSSLHTRPLVREGAPHKQPLQLSDNNVNLVTEPRWVPTPRLTVGHNLTSGSQSFISLHFTL
jgi:hypothetical protein